MDKTTNHPYPRSLPMLIVLLLLAMLTGCATSPFPKQIRQAAKQQPPFSEISARPEAYRGRSVLLGGTIIQTTNQPKATEIEVLQKPLDSPSERPEDTDQSFGRFLVRCPRFLDSAVYAKGREITVAGELQGTEVRQIDQVQYPYPVVGCTQIYLWPIRPPVSYYGYPGPYGYYGNPWWGGWPGYYPYWYPYYW